MKKFLKKFKQIKKENWIIILLTLIILCGAGLRIYYISAQSYWIDEGFTLNAVISTLEKGYPTLDSGFNYSRSILNTYIIAFFVKLFGLTPFAARITSILFGVGTIILIYFFTKKLFVSKYIALASSFLTAFSYWEIAWSRQARMYAQLQFFFILALYLFYLIIKKYTLKRFVLLSFATVAAILSHEFGLLLFPVYIMTYVAHYYGPLVERKSRIGLHNKIKKFLNKYFWPLFITFLIVVPLAGVKVYQFALRRFFPSLVEDASHHTVFISQYFLQWLYSQLPYVIIVAFLGAIIYVIRKDKMFPLLFVIVSFVLPLYIIIYSTDLFHPRYLFFLYPLLFILNAIFVIELINLLKVKIKFVKKYYLTTLMVVLCLFFFNSNFIIVPQKYYALEVGTPQPNFAGAYEAIKIFVKEEPFRIISPYPAMDKVYLGQSDYWFPMSLSGHSSEVVNRNKSLYTGAPKRINLETLGMNTDEKLFFIFDEMALSRHSIEYLDYLINSFNLRYEAKGIWLFEL